MLIKHLTAQDLEKRYLTLHDGSLAWGCSGWYRRLSRPEQVGRGRIFAVEYALTQASKTD